MTWKPAWPTSVKVGPHAINGKRPTRDRLTGIDLIDLIALHAQNQATVELAAATIGDLSTGSRKSSR